MSPNTYRFIVYVTDSSGTSKTLVDNTFTVKSKEIVQEAPAVCTNHTKGDYLWAEKTHPHYRYYKCANCGETFTDRSTISMESCTTCTPPASSSTSNSSTAPRPTIRNGSQGADVRTLQTEQHIISE